MEFLDYSSLTIATLVLTFFAAAMLYAAVGHGGASAYLMVMALMGMEWMVAKPVALVLNVCVSFLASCLWLRKGWFEWRLFWPLALAAVPACYGGAMMPMSSVVFHAGMALVLCCGAVRLLWPPSHAAKEVTGRGLPGLFVMGAVIGFFSGWLGIGGGVFLTPLLLFLRYAQEKTAAAVSAVFILLNSLIGLLGWWHRGGEAPAAIAWLIPAVLLGSWIGASWGSARASSPALRRCLASMLFVAAVKFIWVTG